MTLIAARCISWDPQPQAMSYMARRSMQGPTGYDSGPVGVSPTIALWDPAAIALWDPPAIAWSTDRTRTSFEQSVLPRSCRSTGRSSPSRNLKDHKNHSVSQFCEHVIQSLEQRFITLVRISGSGRLSLRGDQLFWLRDSAQVAQAGSGKWLRRQADPAQAAQAAGSGRSSSRGSGTQLKWLRRAQLK